MDDRILKDKLKNAYNVTSKNKIRFLRTINKRNISIFSFIKNQFKLINKRIYFLGFVYFAFLAILLFILSGDQYLFLASGIPFLSLVMISIIFSSKEYNMEELEMTTLYSLKMVILARMIVIAFFSVLYIGLMAIFTSSIHHVSFSSIVSFFFVPYLLSMYINLLLLRKFKRDGLKYCIVASLLVCLFELSITKIMNMVYVFSICYFMLIVFVAMIIHECRKYLNGLEDYVWNLQ